jgi:hypothetical protein
MGEDVGDTLPNAFNEAAFRKCDCGEFMDKRHRSPTYLASPPVVSVTWVCQSCGAKEQVSYKNDVLHKLRDETGHR